jgi:hypothetical protein
MNYEQSKLSAEQNDKRLVNFMNEIKQAIQNGNFEQPQVHSHTDSLQYSLISNLSNQTFNYIINWLKQQTNEASPGFASVSAHF